MTRVLAAPWRRTVAAVALAALLPIAGGCFGSFHITRKVYAFNKSASPNKWVRWALFMGMNIIPVYWVATLGDVVFANAVEFWTGSNPVVVKLEPRRVVGPDGGVAELVPVENGARIVVTEASGAVHEMTLLREAPGAVAVYDAEGVLVRRVVGLGSSAPRVIEADLRYGPRRVGGPFSSTTLPSGSRTYIEGPVPSAP
jgi:hypothetical protein